MNLQYLESKTKKFLKFLDGYYFRKEMTISSPLGFEIPVQEIYVFQDIRKLILRDYNNFSFHKEFSISEGNLSVQYDEDIKANKISYGLSEKIPSDNFFIEIHLTDNTIFYKDLKKTPEVGMFSYGILTVHVQINKLYHVLAKNKKLQDQTSVNETNISKASLNAIVADLKGELTDLSVYNQNLKSYYEYDYSITEQKSFIESIIMDSIFYISDFTLGKLELRMIDGLITELIGSVISQGYGSQLNINPMAMLNIYNDKLDAQRNILDYLRDYIVEKYLDGNRLHSVCKEYQGISVTNLAETRVNSRFKIFKGYASSLLAWGGAGVYLINNIIDPIDFSKNNKFVNPDQNLGKDYFYHINLGGGKAKKYALSFNQNYNYYPKTVKCGSNIYAEIYKFQETYDLINPHVLFQNWKLKKLHPYK